MKTHEEKEVCVVCGGQGGFSKIKESVLDNNWVECSYCDSYGFVDKSSAEYDDEDDVNTVRYESYKKKITHELTLLSDIQEFNSDVIGRDIYIKVSPHKRNSWVELVKTLIRFSHYNEFVKITPKQSFHYTPESNNYIFWELHIKLSSLSDLDGLVDLLEAHNDSILV